MEPEGSLPHSQVHATCSYPEPSQFSPCLPIPLIQDPVQFWCDFDRASSLICGNKMPTRCNRGFYCRSYCLLNMFRASICPSSGAQEYYTVVAACGISCCGFSSSWSGVEPVNQHPANQTHNPRLHTRPATWKPQHEIPQAATTL